MCVSTWLGVVASIYNPTAWDFETKESLLSGIEDIVGPRPAQTTH